MKKLALVAVLILALVCAWGLMSFDVSISINGQELEGPLEAIAGGWNLVITTVVLFCVAILLAFVLAGVGLVVLGVLALTGLVFAAIAFPFLLPVLIPLFIVWAFCAGIRRGKQKNL